MCVNSASTVLRGAGANGGDKVKTAEHVVAACGKALIKERLAVNAFIVLIGETGLLDIISFSIQGACNFSLTIFFS